MMKQGGSRFVFPAGAFLGAALLFGGMTMMNGCDGSGDDDDTTPPAEETGTPAPTTEPGTPAPTPEPATPTPSGPRLEDGDYYLFGPYVYGLAEQGLPEWPFVTYEAAATFQNDAIIDGAQVWIFWESETDMNEMTDNYCVMPETFEGTKQATTDPKCRNCVATWDMTFYPIEEETTCPEDVVAFWNGETMYGPWEDQWGFVPTPEGYPSDFPKDFIQQMDEYGAKYVSYSAFMATVTWNAEYVVLPYCNVLPDDEACQ